MAWDATMVTMLRVMINDLTTPYTYTDARLEQVIALAASYVTQEIDFDTDYTVTIDPPAISPDPVDEEDSAYMNFVVLKAACIVDIGLYRTKAAIAGVKARLGPGQLETAQHLTGFKDLLTIGPCAAYTTLKKEYEFGDNLAIKAILSPFVSNNFYPSSLSDSDRR